MPHIGKPDRTKALTMLSQIFLKGMVEWSCQWLVVVRASLKDEETKGLVFRKST